jgi:hypothetical protein
MSKEKIQIGEQIIVPGESFSTKALSPVKEPTLVGGIVEDIRGGGFYGRVMLFEDEVIKTSEPDSWHKLWRHVNWELSPFPPQSSKLAAELDFLSGRIINRIIPNLTEGKVITPDSIGYTNLNEIGFGQVLERVRGRGARFDMGVAESDLFATTRKSLTNLGESLGLEHVAQIHPDNPFGKPNIWTTAEGQMIWLDVLPAIRHTGWVWPAFNFKFHRDVREKIGRGEETFNKIHTDKLRRFLREDAKSLFKPTEEDELETYLTMYEERLGEYVQEQGRGKRARVIEDAVRRGIISDNKAKEIMQSNLAYASFLSGTVIQPAINAFKEVVDNTTIYRAFTDKQFQTDIGKFIQDPLFRQEKFIEHTVLRGARNAYDLGLITQAEWEGAWDILTGSASSQAEVRKLTSTYLGLQAWFTISSNIINSISIPVMASSVVAENPGARFALGLFIDMVVPPLVRVASTLTTSLMTNQELKTATMVSAIPKLGGYMAVPADMAKKLGKRSEMIWHYTKRGIIASLSKIMRPWGGWNSDLEETLWYNLSVEKW